MRAAGSRSRTLTYLNLAWRRGWIYNWRVTSPTISKRGDTAVSKVTRREFVGRSLESGAALVAGNVLGFTAATSAEAKPAGEAEHTFVAFTESFQSWPIPEVCERFKAIRLDGLDLTVRPGGHIEPADAAKKLPNAVKAAHDAGLRIAMLSTAIVEADSQAEQLLAAAGEAGIDRIKLGYYRYEKFGTLAERIDEVRRSLAGVAKLAAKHQVLPCVHIHSGDTIPSGGALAYLLLKDFDPRELGAYVDPMHMTVEGGNDGWRQGLDLLAPWIAISSLKNCVWQPNGRDEYGAQQWAFKKCPLADGIARIPDYVARLREVGYRGLFTLHSEYCDRGSWKVLSAEECLEQTRLDLEFAKKLV
jgi:sugar phosphate isomerase/epimerase